MPVSDCSANTHVGTFREASAVPDADRVSTGTAGHVGRFWVFGAFVGMFAYSIE